MKVIIKKQGLAGLLFIIGALHLLIVQRSTKPNLQSQIALVQNEFLDKAPTKIVILGERTSGVSYATQVLQNAFGKAASSHRHIFRHELLDHSELNEISRRTDILWIMVVRSPCEWAEAIIHLQKERCIENNLLLNKQLAPSACDELSPEDYYSTSWNDWMETDDFSGDVIVASKSNQPSKYRDMFEMRQQKLALMKQIMQVIPRHVKILRLHEFERNPDVFVTVSYDSYAKYRKK
jgi:hypothetical protein